MPLVRLGVTTPELNTNTVLASFTSNYLASVIVTNRTATATPQTKVTIWVVPSNATLEAQYAYMCANLLVGVGSTFETFRFAVNPGDQLFVRSTTDNTSFSCTGILQDDSALPQNLPQVFTNKVIRGFENTVLLDRGTTAERRVNADIGYVRFNTETGFLEVKTTATDWFSIGRVGPEGPVGPAGPQGEQGSEGPAGTSLVILGAVADVESLPSELNNIGDIYVVEADGEAYVWDGTSWVSIGTVTGATGPTGPAGEGAITVESTTDSTTFVGLYEDATGTIGGKTNSGITYNADTEVLKVTAIETNSVVAPETLTGTYTISSPTTITLDPVDEIINDAPMKLKNYTVSELSTLVSSVGSLAFCSNETGGAVPVFYDGTNWRRVTDRSVAS
jgi:hypothetical protein